LKNTRQAYNSLISDVQGKSHPHRGIRGGEFCWTSLGFRHVSIFRKDFTVTEKGCVEIYKMGYILGDAALLGACDIIQDGHHLDRHLELYPKL